MNKNMLKLKRILALLVLGFILFGTNITIAKAALFDWLTNSDSSAYANSQSFNFLSVNSDVSTSPNKADLPMIQNSSITANNAPLSAKANAAKTNSSQNSLRELTVTVTAYSSTADQTDDSPFITAWNTHVRDGIVAANFLPLGTRIKIPELYGDKIFIVEDRMNRRFWQKVDIWFPDRTSALEFGVKKLKIQVLES